MSGYLLSVVGIVLFASVLLAIVPTGKTSEIVKAVARLACVITILAPIVQFFVSGGDFGTFFVESSIQTESDFIQYCSKTRVEEAEEILQKKLEDKFGVQVDVDCLWHIEETQAGMYEGQEIRIEKVFVKTMTEQSNDWKQTVETFIQKEYGCEGKVVCVEVPSG